MATGKRTKCYLKLDPAIAKQIEEDRRTGWVNPCAFPDENIVRRADLPNDRATVTRPAFSRDIEKILNIPAYNRYADKTQVFSFVENDDICRRGLHVQLVSRIARGIGRILGLNEDLIEAIALGHDIGHTPFGHAGERYLSKVFHERTGRYFNHNVQSVRVLDRLYQRNISLQVLDGALCHNGEFEKQVLTVGTIDNFDDFDVLVQSCLDDEENIGHLRPSTLEGCVVRVSDMIAYVGKDRADALDMHVIDSYACFEAQVMGVTNAEIINNLTVDIINNSYRNDRICMSDAIFQDLKLAKRQNSELIYLKEGMVDDTSNIVERMFAKMYEVCLRDLRSGDESSPIYKHHIARLLAKSKMLTLEDYLADGPDKIVADYIASMTDNYFMSLYRYLFPEDDLDIVFRGYVKSLS